jgi:hypothetical protein
VHAGWFALHTASLHVGYKSSDSLAELEMLRTENAKLAHQLRQCRFAGMDGARRRYASYKAVQALLC